MHADFAEPVYADSPQDQEAEHHLDEERVDLEQDERLGDDGDDRHAEDGSRDADMAAGENHAADHRGGEGQDQPVVADRRLSEAQSRDKHHAGQRGEKTG